MTKSFFKFLIFCVILAGCKKDPPSIDPDPNALSPELQKVDDLLSSAGHLQTAEQSKKPVKTPGDTVKTTVDSYTDPITGANYNDGGYSVKTKTKYSIEDNPAEFVTYNPWTDLYPGALIQGGTLKSGVPATVPIIQKRRPGRIYLSAVTGNPDMDEWYKEVEMRGSSVTQAMNELLSKHLDKNTGVQYSVSIEQVQSIDELAYKLGLNLDLWGVKLNTSFGNSLSESKTYVAVNIRQLYYTMTYEAQEGFTGVFTDDITERDLKNYTGPGNPICYVASVSYGRSYILMYESTASARKLEAALAAAYSGQNLNSNLEQKNIVNSSKCTVVQLGGDPKAGMETAFGNFDNIKKFLVDGAVVSAASVGVPISYKINHLSDNTTVSLTNTLSYTFSSQEFYPKTPQNNIVIDVFNVKVEVSSGRNISNHSSCIISNLSISYGPAGSMSQPEVLLKSVDLQINHDVDHPVYYTRVFNSFNMDHRIRIKYDVNLHHQTYKGQTHEGDNTNTVVQDFEYNKEDNKWQPIVEKNKPQNPFESLNYSWSGGDMTSKILVNYRFYCDGRVYTFERDGNVY